ncbi:MAG: ester cyclase [Chloroflexota bacterium]
MSNDANAAIVRRYVDEVLNQQNINALDTLLTPGFTHGAERRGVAGQAAALRARFTAFPDAVLTVEDLVSDEDRVALRAVWTGTHQQEWLGIAASKATVTWGIMVFFRLENGKIAHLWAIEDAAALLRQLRDAKPGTGATAARPTPAAV